MTIQHQPTLIAPAKSGIVDDLDNIPSYKTVKVVSTTEAWMSSTTLEAQTKVATDGEEVQATTVLQRPECPIRILRI